MITSSTIASAFPPPRMQRKRANSSASSTYESVEEWLAEVSEEAKVDVSLVMVDIESHRKIEQGAFSPLV